MRKLCVAMMLAMLPAVAGCQHAFQTAQDNTQGFAAGGVFRGEGESYFGTKYAYVDGNFTGTIGAWWEGAPVWTYDANGAVSKAWELYFDTDTNKPAVRETTVEIAKAALARAFPAAPAPQLHH